GHAQVHEHDVRRQRLRLLHGLGAAAGLAHDLDAAGARQHAADAVAHDGVVVHHQHAHGSAHVASSVANAGRFSDTAVPRPGSDSTCSSPPSSAARALMPSSPKPPRSPAGEKPTPSSRTSSVTTSPMYESVTAAREAPACLATFARASCATRSTETSTCGCRDRKSVVTARSAGTRLSRDQV